MEIQQSTSPPQLTFVEYINIPTPTVHHLITRPQIQNQIKLHTKEFVHFCKTHYVIGHQLINKAFLTVDFESDNQKQQCVTWNRIMNSNDSQMMKLYIQQKNDQSEMIDQQVVNGTQQQQEDQQFQARHHYLIYLLKYMIQPIQKIDACAVSEIIKLLNTIIQNHAVDLLLFFRQRPAYLDHFIDLAFQLPNISEMLAKLVAEDSSNSQFRQSKQQIIERMIVNMKASDNLANDHYIYLLDFVQILFNRNRYRHQEYQEIMMITQRFVDEDVIDFFVSTALQMSRSSYSGQNDLILRNCMQYLLLLANRILSDDQIDHYQYQESKQLEPTMNFQLKPILKNYETMIMNQPSNLYSSITRLSYYEFLIKISATRYFSNKIFANSNLVIHLMKIFKNEPNNGLLKIYIINLLEFIINKSSCMSPTDALKIVSALGPVQRLNNSPECRGFIDKIMIILVNKTQLFKNHYKALHLEDKIKKLTYVVGAQLYCIRNKKQNTAQLKFLSRYKDLETQKQESQVDNRLQQSEIDEDFELCFQNNNTKKEEQHEQKENSQNGDEFNGILLLESGNFGSVRGQIDKEQGRVEEES